VRASLERFLAVLSGLGATASKTAKAP
jgi:hypothetical protein